MPSQYKPLLSRQGPRRKILANPLSPLLSSVEWWWWLVCVGGWGDRRQSCVWVHTQLLHVAPIFGRLYKACGYAAHQYSPQLFFKVQKSIFVRFLSCTDPQPTSVTTWLYFSVLPS